MYRDRSARTSCFAGKRHHQLSRPPRATDWPDPDRGPDLRDCELRSVRGFRAHSAGVCPGSCGTQTLRPQPSSQAPMPTRTRPAPTPTWPAACAPSARAPPPRSSTRCGCCPASEQLPRSPPGTGPWSCWCCFLRRSRTDGHSHLPARSLPIPGSLETAT